MAFYPTINGISEGGTGKITATLIYSGSFAKTIDVSGYPGYENFTIDNFSYRASRVWHYTDNDTCGGSASVSYSYNPSTGQLKATFKQNVAHQTVNASGNVYLLTVE